VTATLEEQLRAFAARNAGDHAMAGWAEGTSLPEYVAEHHRARGRAAIVGVAMLAVLALVVGVVVWRTGEDRSQVVVDDPVPVPPPDPALVIAARAEAGGLVNPVGPEFSAPPTRARVVVTTAGQVGESVVGIGCGESHPDETGKQQMHMEYVEADTPVTVIELTWDEAVTVLRNGEAVGEPTVQWRRPYVGTPPYVRGSAPCVGGGGGLIPDDIDFEGLGPIYDVSLDNQAAITASSVAMSASSLIDRLPVSAELVVTAPDRLAELGMYWDPGRCAAVEVMVVQLNYRTVESSYLGEGPDGAVNVPIGSTITSVPLPLDSATQTACGRGTKYSEGPIDLSGLGDPVHVDLTR
jgi:hypothetical protein